MMSRNGGPFQASTQGLTGVPVGFTLTLDDGSMLELANCFGNWPQTTGASCVSDALTLPAPPPSPRPPPPCTVGAEGCRSSREMEHFALLNAKRAEGFTCPGGTSFAPNPEPLAFDCRLWRASQLHSQDMADNNYFSHISQDGRTPGQRASAQGAPYGGENIAAGNAAPEAVLNQWLESNGHCMNMGNPSYKIAAVGYGYTSETVYRHYWTQMFASSAIAADTTSC